MKCLCNRAVLLTHLLSPNYLQINLSPRFPLCNPELKGRDRRTDRSSREREKRRAHKTAMASCIFPARIAVGSAAVLSAILALWLATPVVADILAAGVPRIYGSMVSWLTPPYLYIIINGIIISIVATSRYQKPVFADVQLPPFSEQTHFHVDDAALRAEVLDPRTGGDDSRSLSVRAEPEKEEFVISRSSWVPKRGESKDSPDKSTGNGLAVDKPLVSSRISHRRSIKASPEGKALGVARPRKNDTLESTWRTLTEGRAVPLARHLKKFDSCATHARATAGDPTTPPATHEIQQFQFFTVRSSSAAGSSPPSSGGGYSSSVARVRREPSLGQDDLNRRVEAFIKKFNEEMRLQRQESLQKYKDMINRGSH